MNIITAFITNSQSTKLVQPSKCSLDHPAKYTKATAVFSSAFCQKRIYAQLMQCISMGLTVISSITQNAIRSFTRMTYFARNRRNRLNQRQKLSYVMAVGSGDFHRKRDTICVGD